MSTDASLYKERLSNASISVAEGSVERPSWLRAVRQTRRQLKRLTRWRRR